MKKLINILAWAFLVLCVVSAAVMCVVGTIDGISKNEDTWQTRFVDLPSVKLSEED